MRLAGSVEEPAPIVLLPGVVVVVLRSVVVDPAPILVEGVVVELLRSVVDDPAPMVPLLDGVVVEEPEPVVPLPAAPGVVDESELVPGVVVPDGEAPVVPGAGATGAPGDAVCAIARPIETAAALAIRPLSKVEVFIW